MESYRSNIIKQIIHSPDIISVESIIDTPIQRLIDNGTHVIFVLRTIDKLKTSLSEIKKDNVSQQEWENVTKALTILKDYDKKN
jgi:hypothetical protein